MRLRLIEEADFRKNEMTNYEIAQKKYKLRLGAGDVICFYSQAGTQVVFVHRPFTVDFGDVNRRPGEAQVYRSERLRLSDRTWDPLLIQNYANEVGIELDGIPRFERFMKNLRVEHAEKAAKRRKQANKEAKTGRRSVSLVA